MSTKLVSFEISEELYERLYRTGAKLKSADQSYADSIDNVVEIAISEDLDRQDQWEKDDKKSHQ